MRTFTAHGRVAVTVSVQAETKQEALEKARKLFGTVVVVMYGPDDNEVLTESHPEVDFHGEPDLEVC